MFVHLHLNRRHIEYLAALPLLYRLVSERPATPATIYLVDRDQLGILHLAQRRTRMLRLSSPPALAGPLPARRPALLLLAFKAVPRRRLTAVVTVLLQFLKLLLQCPNPLFLALEHTDELLDKILDQRNDRVSASIVGRTYLPARDLEARVHSGPSQPSA